MTIVQCFTMFFFSCYNIKQQSKVNYAVSAITAVPTFEDDRFVVIVLSLLSIRLTRI